MKESKRIIRFILSSLFSYMIEIALFTFMTLYLGKTDISYVIYIPVATFIARAVSGVINYILNKTRVFEKGEMDGAAGRRYAVLWAGRMLLSAAIVPAVFSAVDVNESIIKAAVDIVLFVLGYIVQLKWVFKGSFEK